MQLYSFQSYKLFLQSHLKARQALDAKFSFSWLADQAGVQRSYMSRVMKGQANLSSDQLYAAARALKLPPEERDYLLPLLEIDRCAVPERRQELEKTRDRLQQKKLSAAEAL